MLRHASPRVPACGKNECLDVRLPARLWGERVASEIPRGRIA